MKVLFSRINIIKLTEEELILRVNPVLVHLFTLALIGLTLFLFLFTITTTYSTTLSCEKFTSKSEVVSCKLLNTNFLGIKREQNILFADLPHAAIVKRYNDKANQPEYQAVLATNVEEIVLVRHPSDYHYKQWQQNTIQLNEFINNNNKKILKLKEKNDDVVFTGFGLAFFFTLVGMIIWITKTDITCTLSHKTKELAIERKRLFGKQIVNYSLKDLEKVLLETSDGMDTTTSRITFKFKAGTLIPLISYYDSYSGKEEAVRYMNRFIK
ncbi:MAG: hypothetical protein KME09_00760 [Pleurocapsa minor HA4230-MV1]|jgi:hypothetical protein|nr:hypothetical protein [Pleurocapsa minor HA4230-MV1]